MIRLGYTKQESSPLIVPCLNIYPTVEHFKDENGTLVLTVLHFWSFTFR